MHICPESYSNQFINKFMSNVRKFLGKEILCPTKYKTDESDCDIDHSVVQV